MLNKKIFFLVALLWTLILTYLSLATLDTSFGNKFKIEYKDKMVHFVFYFLFVLLWNFFSQSKSFDSKKAFWITIVAIFYGVFMEICQAVFTTTRTADIFDVLSNSFGAIVGFFVFKYNSKRK